MLRYRVGVVDATVANTWLIVGVYDNCVLCKCTCMYIHHVYMCVHASCVCVRARVCVMTCTYMCVYCTVVLL